MGKVSTLLILRHKRKLSLVLFRQILVLLTTAGIKFFNVAFLSIDSSSFFPLFYNGIVSKYFSNFEGKFSNPWLNASEKY